MPNYLKIQGNIDKKLRKNGFLFEIMIPQPGTYSPVTGVRNRGVKLYTVWGIKLGSEVKPINNVESGFNDYVLMLSALDSSGVSYEMPPKGSRIMINGREVEIVDSVRELNLTNVPLFYKIILRNI